LRDRYDEIKSLGGDVVAIGTGSRTYAAAFVEEEHVPFPVLVDDDGEAASAARVRSIGFFKLIFNREALAGGKRARQGGHRIHRSGKRVTQLGATFVLGAGDRIRYEYADRHSADHAPIDEVVAALR
jgi:peroxiredoxin